jgi:hypothetical protein
MEKIKYVMIDIEALGKMPNGIITNIGAVKFDLENTPEYPGSVLMTVAEVEEFYFYRKIDTITMEKKGYKMDVDTVLWWMQQDREAQKELFPASNDEDFEVALHDLGNFTKGCLAIAQPAYYDLVAINQTIPVMSWKQMIDTGSMIQGWTEVTGKNWINTYRKYKKKEKTNIIKHHALHDAIMQARCLCFTYQEVKEYLNN